MEPAAAPAHPIASRLVTEPAAEAVTSFLSQEGADCCLVADLHPMGPAPFRVQLLIPPGIEAAVERRDA
eukprot:CAMPEP_0117546052 /NCGR_PEP_ID=MMETSP0784-20121206/46410_1 /TAXON_ID=39447 /ORGANISM="" /LENGTH=68 /DNA_ID=CAMNT_0005342915 /DNA_START=386 /DNA_END=592 /DNA_ORIENTATION=-